MASKKRPKKRKKVNRFSLPEERSRPSDDIWQYAYLLTGQKKIGKTKFAIEGANEIVAQFDKPQLAYEIREVMIDSWVKFLAFLSELERRAEENDFPWNRIVIDGAGEWYTLCQEWVCEYYGVGHPSEEGYARAWHKLRDEFTAAVNRVLRLQDSVKCGVVFIAHTEWKEKILKDKSKIDVLVPNLPNRCEEILNGKVDAWFHIDWDMDERVMTVLGDEMIHAGHRIDGHFLTLDGRRVKELHMGGSATEALKNFRNAFDNRQTFATISEYRKAESATTVKRKKVKKRGKKRKA